MQAYDYYENGPYTSESSYVNYSWIPDYTFQIAGNLIDRLGLERDDMVVDFGCAKGYLVKALRELGYDAHGFDTSEYAITHADEAVREYVNSQWFPAGDWCICKDTLQQFDNPQMFKLLPWFFRRICVIVPLGEGGEFISESARRDAYNVTAEPLAWWAGEFFRCGWYVRDATDDLADIIPYSVVGERGMIIAESRELCEYQ